MPVRVLPPRLPASLLASAGAHGLAVALLVWLGGPLRFPSELPRAELIFVSLVSLPGGGGGAKGDGAPAVAASPAPPAPVPPPAAAPPAAPPPTPVVRHAAKKTAPTPPVQPAPQKPVPAPAPVTAARAGTSSVAPGAAGASGGLGGRGGGDGSGGDGSGGARPAYGSNPKPIYPLAARRLGQEGRVWLEAVVNPDGRPSTVRVQKSSGHRALDQAALATVQKRWRFIPARRNGAPVESTVTFPVRFQLTDD